MLGDDRETWISSFIEYGEPVVTKYTCSEEEEEEEEEERKKERKKEGRKHPIFEVEFYCILGIQAWTGI